MAGFRTHLRFYKAVLATALPVLLCCTAPVRAEEELCMDGTLLFREDFGGNDPNDPIVGTDKVPGMDYSNYTQRLNADHVTGQPGLFWLIKSGYYHADTTNGRDPMKNHSNWYLQDDHTYPNDKSRGYLLEIDGKGGKAPFYSTVISDLCPASRLTFSAYVANVNKASNYIDGQHARIYPRLRFELTDAETGAFLADHSTGDIPYDPDLTVNTDFWYSSKWYLHGMNFEVPAGVTSIRLTIYNDVENNGAGNDFALDDIEIRLCAPPVTIEGPDGVCKGNSAELTAHFENDGTFAEPLEYTWLYSSSGKPNGTWTNIGTWDNENGLGMWMNIVNEKNAGWYKFMVAGSGNSANGHCRVVSEPYLLRLKNCSSHNQNLCMDGTLLFREDFGGNDPDDPSVSTATVPGMDSRYSNTGVNGGMGSWRYTIRKEGYTNGIQWHLQDDHTCPDDKNRGYFLEIDGGGGDIPFYSKTIDGLCAGSVLTFSAYVINVHYAGQIQWFYENNRGYVYPRLKFVLIDPSTGTTLANESTGDILPDYSKIWDISLKESAEWQFVGTTFQVPVGVESIQMYIYNDVSTNGNGNDFALDDIEIRVCLNAAIEGQHEVCENEPVKLTASSPDFSPLTNPAYKWYFSADSLTWTELDEQTYALTRTACRKDAHEGWYRVAIAGTGNIDRENCRAMSEPFRLTVKSDCKTEETLCMDGTLLFREDFGGNDPSDPRLVNTPADIPGMTYEQLLTDRFGTMKSGGFLITKEGYCNGDTSVTNPTRGSQWHLQDDHTYPGDKTRGYFLEIDGRGDHAAFYTRTIDLLCEGMRLTFSAYVANVVKWNEYTGRPGYFAYPRLEFVLTDPDGNKLKSYDTGDIPFDSTYLNDFSSWQYSSKWHLVGMNFEVPEGVSSVTLTIYNNVEGWIGNDFALDDIEIRLCVPPVTIEGPNEVCLDAKPTLTAHFDNDGTFSNPDYQWYFSTDSAGFYNEIDPAMALTYTIENAQKADEGWYRIGISERGQMAYMNCRAMSEPFHLTVKECEREEDTITDEITVCEDELPYTWHGHEFTEAEEEYTYTEYTATQAITYIYTLHTKYCPPPCPETLIAITEDSTICGYALPFVWHDAVFDRPSTQTVIEKNERGCDTFVYTLTVDTVYCVRRYPIIVNKYNWVLLVDNIAVRRLFPDKTPVAYQWYKDDEPIAGATEDDYSEQNELHGVFSMLLHFADGSSVWSNIIDLSQTPTAAPVRVKAYNSSGILVREWQATDEQGGLSLPPGIYLLRYEGGDEVFTEKRIVP